MTTTVLFDLDGTLTDPQDGITRAIQYAFKKLGEQVPTTAQLLSFIGPPLAVSFTQWGFDDEKTKAAIAYYREYFVAQGMFENEVYDGVIPMLQALKASGKTLAVATSKPQVFAVTILEHFQLATYFDVIIGSELDGTRSTKAEVIAEVLRQLQCEPEQCVMVGDRLHDMVGAAAHQLATIGVTYGYGDEQELRQAGAQQIVVDVASLHTALLR